MVLTEGLRLVRAAGALLIRPGRSVADMGGRAASAALNSEPVRQVLGEERAREVRDKAKEGMDIVDQLQSQISAQTIKATTQNLCDQANGMLKSGGIDMRIMGPEDPNWPKVRLVDQVWAHNVEEGLLPDPNDELDGGSSCSSSDQGTFSRRKAREFVRIMKQSKDTRGGDLIMQRYVDNLLADAQFRRVSHLPTTLERKLYYDIIRTTVQVFETSIQSMHNINIIGHSVRVDYTHNDYSDDGSSWSRQSSGWDNLQRANRNWAANQKKEKDTVCSPIAHWTKLNEKRVEMVIDHIMQSQRDLRKYDALLPVIEKQFIITISQVALRILSDLFCDERLKISVLGHRLRWYFDPMGYDEIERMFQERQTERARVNKKAIRLFVDELLKDEDMNILWLPDVVEAEIYEHALTIVMCILEDVLDTTDVTILGIKFHLSLVDAINRNPYPRKLSMSGREVDNEEVAEIRKKLKESGIVQGAVDGLTGQPIGRAQKFLLGDPDEAVTAASEPVEEDEEPEELKFGVDADGMPYLMASENQLKDRIDAIYREAEILENMIDKKESQIPAAQRTQAVRKPARMSEKGDMVEEAAIEEFPELDMVRSKSRTSRAMKATSAAVGSDEAIDGISIAEETQARFKKICAEDSLARFLQLKKPMKGINVQVPFTMIKDVETYMDWMPLCTGGEVLERDPNTGEISKCNCAFGIDTGTFIGVLGDNVRYEMTITQPEQIDRKSAFARVVADTGDGGFRYGKRLIYDWVFVMTETASGEVETEVILNLFMQVSSSLYLPLMDAMQENLTKKMLDAFENHAVKIKGGIPQFKIDRVQPSKWRRIKSTDLGRQAQIQRQKKAEEAQNHGKVKEEENAGGADKPIANGKE